MEDIWRLHEGYTEDSRIGNGAGVLNLAAARGDLKTVKYVLKHGCSHGVPYDYYATPLRLAGQYGHADIASLLMKKIADMSGKRLMKAAKHGRFNEVRTLLSMGVIASPKTKSLWTPLHYAAKFGHLSIVKCLIDNGAEVNCRGAGGQTPLFEAAFYGNMEIAKILVVNGADVNTRGYGSMTPVEAAYRYNHRDVAEYLVTNSGRF